MKRSLRSLCAAGAMFTRLPFWRFTELDREDYEHVIDWWPVVGLLTGGAMAGAFWLFQLVLPVSLAIIMALGLRLVLTGGFHEDGLGDFFDGFGSGGSRERILAIMKDSHIGSYAVLGYIFYYGLIWQAYLHLGEDPHWICSVMLYADVLGKWVSSIQVQRLPYARDEKTSKTGVVYRKADIVPRIIGTALVMLLPRFLAMSEFPFSCLIGATLVGLCLMLYIKIKIGGYTGDTCGAIALLVELSAVLLMLLV